MTRHVLALLAFLFVVLTPWFLASCVRESDQERIQHMEKEFQKAFETHMDAFDDPSVQEKAKELTTAYETYADSHPGDTLSAIYLASASDLYDHTLNDPPKAIDMLDRVLKDYPDTRYAEEALFTKAYIYHNQLRDLNTAKALYESFIKKFPQSSFADDAQFELENLGVPDQQLFPRIPIVQDTLPTPAS